ncbi:hypothetical protein EJ06DRAFT_486253 [Trichodelitschia bisporula]|uniref:RING-type E3 ubiquitin transferase n=1 Tax=Trichodelitschia bisporula TaxID=703511 RepID=A0A6G1IBM6_9PEZI|nr:hypothetical protein EJ06DRAFT_486253 [Trichodelitschia bisporula]
MSHTPVMASIPRDVSSAQHSNAPRGRGGGRGGSAPIQREPNTETRQSRGGSARRGNNRRRGGNNPSRVAPSQNPGTVPTAPQTTTLPGARVLHDHLAQNATQTGSEDKGKSPAVDAGDDDDPEVCFICASPVVHTAVAPCNHRTCHICSLRLRALYRTKACAHCRTQSDFVIFTDEPAKRYEEFQDADFVQVDASLGIKYENSEIHEDTILLLQYNCPDSDCDVACLGWPDLHRHVKMIHQKVMCDLCTRNKKVFTHEHELFTPSALHQHERHGDNIPGAVDQTGFRGHPECGFCRKRFYGDDELYLHCRDRHEKCHVCDRRDQGRRPQYYRDYNDLAKHFVADHFPCSDAECLEKKFVVFESEMDLKAHQLEAHPKGLSKDALRDTRRVDLRDFQVHEPFQPPRGSRSGGRGRGRGRDPNAEPLPQSSAQPLRRDELAYQRQMAIQSAQSLTSRNFGGQLSAPTQQRPGRVPPSNGGARSNVVGGPPSVNPLGATLVGFSPRPTSPNPEATLTPQEQARRVRHGAVIERASNLLGNDPSKLAEFRAKISAFRVSSISASDLVEALFSLFDSSSVELGKLIKELADIFEISSKQDDLLTAWNDWKAINEDYPSLPGSSAASTSRAASSLGGKRVLRLKNSTAQSSRASVSRSGSWGAPNSNLFPTLPTNNGAGDVAGRSSHPTPSTSTPAQSKTRPQTTRRVPASASLGDDSFPALPAVPKPLSTMFTPGYTGGGVRRDHASNKSAPSAWGGPGASSSNASEEATTAQSKKKGNKNKKQTLMHFG